MIGVGLSLPQVAVRRVAAAASGPTVILNAAYATDTLLDDVGGSISTGENISSWAMATGGTWTRSDAVTAGASDWLVYHATNGVHTNGTLGALTCATPVTIPADADCVIYVKCNLSSGQFFPLGKAVGLSNVEFDGEVEASITTEGGSAFASTSPSAGVNLLRIRRVSNAWRFAWTGFADSAAFADTLAGAAVTFDTLLASNSMGAFSATGQYLQKLYIYHGSSIPDTAYETANGGTL